MAAGSRAFSSSGIFGQSIFTISPKIVITVSSRCQTFCSYTSTALWIVGTAPVPWHSRMLTFKLYLDSMVLPPMSKISSAGAEISIILWLDKSLTSVGRQASSHCIRSTGSWCFGSFLEIGAHCNELKELCAFQGVLESFLHFSLFRSWRTTTSIGLVFNIEKIQ